MIRSASPEDAPALAALIAVLGYDLDEEGVRLNLEACSDLSRVFVATADDGAVTGFLSFHLIPLFHQRGHLGRITAMAIDPAYHRHGIGRALVAAAEGHALAHGCTRIEVTSGDHRSGDAHLFYQSLGYLSDCRRFLKSLASG